MKKGMKVLVALVGIVLVGVFLGQMIGVNLGFLLAAPPANGPIETVLAEGDSRTTYPFTENRNAWLVVHVRFTNGVIQGTPINVVMIPAQVNVGTFTAPQYGTDFDNEDTPFYVPADYLYNNYIEVGSATENQKLRVVNATAYYMAIPSDCPNGVCDYWEDGASCPADCGGPFCGDGTCDADEDCYSCEQDCGACSTEYCGDGVCNGDETCTSCPDDCGVCPECVVDQDCVPASPVDGVRYYCDSGECKQETVIIPPMGGLTWAEIALFGGLGAAIVIFIVIFLKRRK